MVSRFSNIAWALVVLTGIVFAGCQTLTLDGLSGADARRAFMDGGDHARHRYYPVPIAPPFEEAWRYNAAAAFGPGQPLLVGDAVLVGNRNGELHAVTLEDGKRIGMRTAGESLEGPLLVDNGRVYVANAWGKYVLSAYDLIKGNRLWRVRGIPFETAPVLAAGQLIAFDVEGNVRAFDPDSGEERWIVSSGEGSTGEASPLLIGDDRLFVVANTGRAMMLSADDGELIWQQELGRPVYTSPIADGERLFVPTTRGILEALSTADGSTLWTFDVGDPLVRFSPPAAEGGYLHVGASSGRLYRLDVATGRVLWQFDAPDAIVAPPLLTEDYLMVGTMGRMLYVFERASEDMVWEAKLDGRIKSGFAVKDGMLVVLAEPRYIYGFRMEEANATRP